MEKKREMIGRFHLMIFLFLTHKAKPTLAVHDDLTESLPCGSFNPILPHSPLSWRRTIIVMLGIHDTLLKLDRAMLAFFQVIGLETQVGTVQPIKTLRVDSREG